MKNFGDLCFRQKNSGVMVEIGEADEKIHHVINITLKISVYTMSERARTVYM